MDLGGGTEKAQRLGVQVGFARWFRLNVTDFFAKSANPVAILECAVTFARNKTEFVLQLTFPG